MVNINAAAAPLQKFLGTYSRTAQIIPSPWTAPRSWKSNPDGSSEESRKQFTSELPLLLLIKMEDVICYPPFGTISSRSVSRLIRPEPPLGGPGLVRPDGSVLLS